jgi:hypothetical protein
LGSCFDARCRGVERLDRFGRLVDGRQDLAPMAERQAKLLKVFVGQIVEYGDIDGVVGKRCAYWPRSSFASQSAIRSIAAIPRASVAR